MCEELMEQFAYTLGLRRKCFAQRAELYVNSIESLVSPLEKVIGFIDCTKIRMCRLGGTNVNQRACYSGEMKFHCLIYQPIST